jgi:hypothetical protein
LLTAPAGADIAVTLNPQTESTDVSNGVLTLDEISSDPQQPVLSHTYVDVGGGGLDIKVTGAMKPSTGGLDYTWPDTRLHFRVFCYGDDYFCPRVRLRRALA